MPKLQTLKPRLREQPSKLLTIQPGSWRSTDASSTQRGYGYKWQQARATYLAAHPFCAYCLRAAGISYEQDAVAIGLQCPEARIGLPYANVVDHKVPHRGDEVLFWDETNWQALCATHHSRDKQREEAMG